MYESPIELFDVASYTKKANEEIDNYIYEYIVKLGINVNKEELIKALQYDRDQYEKGFKDGYKDGYRAITCANFNCMYNDYTGHCTCKEPRFSWGHIHTVNDGLKDIWECKSFEYQQNTKAFKYCENDVKATEEVFNLLKDDGPVIITEITEGEQDA